MPYAVDNDRFAAAAALAAPDREQRRAALDLAPERPILLFAGKLTPIKAPEVALGALARLKAGAGRPPYLLFAGDGPLRAQLESEAASRGLADDVRFLGFRNQRELPAFYDLCDVFLLPSRREPWGLVVNEAMNAGRAIVASDQVGSAADLVRPGVNGAIVPAGDEAALAAALADITADPQPLPRHGRGEPPADRRLGLRAGRRRAEAGARRRWPCARPLRFEPRRRIRLNAACLCPRHHGHAAGPAGARPRAPHEEALTHAHPDLLAGLPAQPRRHRDHDRRARPRLPAPGP